MKIIHNGIFHTFDSKTPQAVLIDQGIIKDLYYEKPRIAEADYVDLKGNHVYPGFIDTHTHSFEGGLYSLSADLLPVASLQDVFDIIDNTNLISNMIFSYQFDENKIKEKRFPTREELDQISTTIPILLRRIDGHSCVINSAAAKKIPWARKLSDTFNGFLNKRDNDFAANWFHQQVDAEGILQAYYKAAELAIKSGHTTIHTMIGNGKSDPEHFQFLQSHLSEFPVEFILYPQITDVKKALDLGSPRIGGCILADGSFGSYTAALLDPYSDKTETNGALYQTDDFWNNFVEEAHHNDLQIFIHAIGDAAVQQVCNAYAFAQKTEFKDIRHAVIHNELTPDSVIKTMQKNHIAAVMQPQFDRLWAGSNGLYQRVLGKRRTTLTNRFRNLLDHNILVTGGSDWYVTEMNAISGIYAANNTHHKENSISLEEAIQLYTSNAAVLSFDENRLGKIKVGFQADFVVVNNPIEEMKSENEIDILSVIKKGRIRNLAKDL